MPIIILERRYSRRSSCFLDHPFLHIYAFRVSIRHRALKIVYPNAPIRLLRVAFADEPDLPHAV